MEIKEVNSVKCLFFLDGHVISLDKDKVERFSDLICPVTEQFLRTQIETALFQKQKNDALISEEIELDMAYELSGYGQ